MKRIILTTIPLLATILVISCDKGIKPRDQKPGFSGIVEFSGTWPDSAKRTHLIVFRNKLGSAADFNITNLAYVSDTIPFGTTSLTFNTNTDPALISSITPGQYEYVVIAQSKQKDISLNRGDWFVAAVYYNQGDTTQPGKLIIPGNTFVREINIKCNFNNLPPQPPG